MAKHCKHYILNCLMCKCKKAYTVQKQGLFNLLPIPNFVIKLLKCCKKNKIFQHILVVVDQLTKQHLYEPFKTLHTGEFIDAIHCCVFALYGFLLTTVND